MCLLVNCLRGLVVQGPAVAAHMDNYIPLLHSYGHIPERAFSIFRFDCSLVFGCGLYEKLIVLLEYYY